MRNILLGILVLGEYCSLCIERGAGKFICKVKEEGLVPGGEGGGALTPNFCRYVP